MTQNNLTNRIDKLEILFSEQDFTVEALNDVITRQSGKIDQLEQQLELMKHQLKELKKQIPETATIVNEKPPHY